MSNVKALVLLLLLSCTSCSLFQPGLSYYDSTTYKNLTDLKPQVVFLYQGLSDKQIDEKSIATIRLKLAQIYEYENGKGKDNEETTKQIQVIQAAFERNIKERRDRGPFKLEFRNDLVDRISKDFDHAIQSEALKNKNVSS